MATPIPSNDASFTLGEILATTAGRLSGPLTDEALEVRGVTTDTRSLRPGEAFVALAGERFDGHDHLASAAAAGAVLAIVGREMEAPPGMTQLVVPSTLEALGALAAAHLDRWRRASAARRVLALTGSAGKSTTKEAIVQLLAAAQPHGVHATQGNLNNLVGVPMTLFGLGEAHRYAVVEMGTNAPGEIPRLSRMVRPDLGLVTLVAAAHTEGIGTIDDVAVEKNSLFMQLTPEGCAIGNADDERVIAGMMRCNAGGRVRYGRDAEGGYRIVDRRMVADDAGLRSIVTLERPDGTRLTATIPLLGEVGALAMAAAVATVETLVDDAVDGEVVSRALGVMGGRMNTRRAPSGLLVIDDSYNSNPASARASIATAGELAETLGRRLVLVLGEMRELGELSEREHVGVGEAAVAAAPAFVIAVAGDAARLAERVREAGTEALFADDADGAAEVAVARCQPDDIVLVKGSRGVRTERVVEALLGGDVPPARGSADGPEQPCSSAGGAP
ncbi:MAG TPA: UDP-N-acetylmuramoyl-tripeptide--D-alanyl-D-alanine ligase [Polyangiaceae bacterium]|nr:UDP-N-acetylmuramoyl-tripeptide--D-alanyl-D-alanine ligase [Polyangiaceae bacterium]